MAKIKLGVNMNEGMSFKDKLYILNSGSVYGVYIVNNHVCMSSMPTLEDALASLERLIERYGDYHNMIKVLNNCEYSPKLSPATLEARKIAYEQRGTKYLELVSNIIDTYENRCMEIRREKVKVKPLVTKKKKKKLIKRA